MFSSEVCQILGTPFFHSTPSVAASGTFVNSVFVADDFLQDLCNA